MTCRVARSLGAYLYSNSIMRIFIHQANMVDKNNKQYKRNQTIIAQTKKT